MNSEMNRKNIEVAGLKRFYDLAHDISTVLVGAQAPEIDMVLDDCLRQVGEYFDVNTVGLGQISKAGELLPSLRLWGGSAAAFLGAPAPGPEMVAYFSRNGSVTWNCLEDLDELPQWREHCRHTGSLAGSLWLYKDFGSFVHGMAISRPEPKTWPADTIEHLGAVGEVLFNAIYRRQAEVEMELLQRLERAISGIAARFVQVPPDQVDAEIQDALQQIAAATDADLCILVQCDDEGAPTKAVDYEWAADTLDGPFFRGTPLNADYPWLTRHLMKGTPLRLTIADDFPRTARDERKSFEQFGIESMIWAPYEAVENTRGFIALGTVNPRVQWADGIERQLGLIGNVLANAIDRKVKDLALAGALEEIQDLKDRLLAENETLRQEVVDAYPDDMLVGKSHVFRAAMFQADQVAPTDSTVLILGETGTGKGLIARRIHEQSGRNQQPMVTVNCAALPSTLIESELFGHEKGAFTGAINRKIGRFELADGGTIFLDEVGDMPIELQAKMLRVLQDQQFERVGSSTTKTVDVRVIAATNRNLDQLVEDGEFRADLYYRLGVFPIRAPALKERRHDIPLLVWFFVSELEHRLGKTFDEVSAPSMEALTHYDWPGNVRELKNMVERAMILSTGKVLELGSWFPGNLTTRSASTQLQKPNDETLEAIQRAHIVEVLDACDWKIRGKDGAAERLGLKRTTLQSRMKKLGIVRPTA
jgi:formate hydrogenlyase transcriptional activator